MLPLRLVVAENVSGARVQIGQSPFPWRNRKTAQKTPYVRLWEVLFTNLTLLHLEVAVLQRKRFSVRLELCGKKPVFVVPGYGNGG
jgi:hypothetical protein